MKDEVIAAFKDTWEKFENAVVAFGQDELNQLPFDGSWTAGQVAEHVLKAASNFPKLLAGKRANTERPIEEKRKIVEGIFLDFTTKMKSPDFILPGSEPKDKEALLEAIKKTGSEIAAALPAYELADTCLDFVLPNLGSLTGYEWGWFIITHTMRHTHQLQNIHAAIYQ